MSERPQPATGEKGEAGSAWSPLRIRLFRMLWLATLASNIGTWMHDIGAGWLMTSLSSAPVMVALVQTATTLPILFLALPAGALSDIVDRRRYLLGIQLWLAGIAALLGILTQLELITAWMLVGLTFAMGIGAALMMPAWAAVTPELVPKSELQGAIALNSMGINVARAIGPAVAGVIVSTAGPGPVFLLNAVSFAGVMLMLYSWKRETVPTTLPAERFFSALRVGVRFARHHAPLQAAVIRGVGFFLFASALWALLPLIAKHLIDGGPQAYGALVASIGVGAVVGAIILPPLRKTFSKDRLVAGATICYAFSMLALAYLDRLPPLCVAMLVSGIAWITVLSSLQVAAQLALPNWVRSRGLAVFMAAFMGSMAFGSLVWGSIAQQTSIATALMVAAAGAALATALTRPWKIGSMDELDLMPSMHWPTPAVHPGVTHDRGPVMVTIEYEVNADELEAFVQLMQELGRSRKRDGAFIWGVMEFADQANRFLEYFMVESWLEHLRQHERVTNTDKLLQERLQQLLVPGTSPHINHYLAPGRSE